MILARLGNTPSPNLINTLSLFLFTGVDVSTVFSGDLVPSLYQPPYTLDSTARHSYQAPVLRNELSENLSQRFGCNRNIYKPAVGAGNIKQRTYPVLSST